MQVVESKSILAKLLATEDITIEHQPVQTAMFDVKDRRLILPKWRDMSNSVYDLLIGHEVGHALETPPEGWHDAVAKDPGMKSFLNVLEDARQERKTKQRYPGLVRSFYAGYRELFDKDFFGVKDMDVNTLPLIDRINLHFKVGSFLNVQFKDNEQAFVSRVEALETWDDVEALATELYGYSKQEAEEKLEEMASNGFGEEQDDVEDFEMSSMPAPSDTQDAEQDEDSELEEGFGGSAETGEEQETEQQDEETSGTEETSEVESEVEDWAENGGGYSITDQNFRENEDQLLSNDSIVSRYVEIPRLPNWKEYIVPAKDIYIGLEQSFELRDSSRNTLSSNERATKLLAEFVRTNTPVINQMVQQFEMKRKASVLSKVKMSKTGDLNENKLWAYKLTEDIFKQSMVVPEGKSHGMVMFLDMSGSMYRNLQGTVDQLLNQIMFCRKVNIPYEVYGFTGVGYDQRYNINEIGVFCPESKILRHLFSSEWNKRKTDEAYKYLLMLKEHINARNNYWTSQESLFVRNDHFSLGGTPLNSTVAYAIEIVKDFRKKYPVEVVNTIFLTDGGATDRVEFIRDENYQYPSYTPWKEHLILRYGSISVPTNRDNYTHPNTLECIALLELFKKVTGSRVINYFLADNWSERSVEGEVRTYHPEVGYDVNYGAQRKEGVVVDTPKVGFDIRFILKGGKALMIDDGELEVKSNKKGDLIRGFRNFNKNKVQTRVFLSKFMDMVA